MRLPQSPVPWQASAAQACYGALKLWLPHRAPDLLMTAYVTIAPRCIGC